MRRANAVWVCAAMLLGATSLIGCGSDHDATPTAPSAGLVAATPSAIVTVEQLDPLGAVSTTTPVTVTGLVSGTTCPTLGFTVGTYSFRVTAGTQYTGGACANIQPGAKFVFTGSRESETSTLFTVATLTFPSGAAPTPTPTPTPTPSPTTPTPAAINTEGTITATGSGKCPELQFYFGSYSFTVSTSTQYSGGSCSDLKPGARVALAGSKKEGESFIRVASVTFKRDTPSPAPSPTPAPPTPAPPTPVSAEVTVTGVAPATSCPALGFLVGPYTIAVSSATSYEGGGCVNIAAGVRLRLTGVREGDGPVSAAKIEFLTPSAPGTPSAPAEGEGVVTGILPGTACPALQFYIGSYLIMVGSSTRFDNGSCADVTAGVKMYVRGTVTGERTVAASSITIERAAPAPQPEGEGEARVSTLVSGTACPAVAFTFGDYVVSTDSSTRFVGGTCAAIAPGVKLRVHGRLTGDRRALATEITFEN